MPIQPQFILFVSNQKSSATFYSELLQQAPSLDVPGMTEFTLTAETKLGLMPYDGIAKIITPALAHPAASHGISRCELYLMVNDVNTWFNRAILLGAKLVSEVQPRTWGHVAGYVSDFDGHVIAFAQQHV